MRIQIVMAAAQARKELALLRSDLTALQRQVVASNAVMGANGSSLRKWGSQIQWAGRQLTYNFSIPLAIAGGAAAKWALDNEAAAKRISKVYGDLSMSSQQVKNETDALGKTFSALSSLYGVQQSDVLNLAADWAAAGATGIALAKSVRLTLDTMILGEMEAADATKALISIQAQYGESIDELSKTIDVLNMVENQTGATMSDLIVSMSRSAGVARTAGVDVRHLAAMTAALVPAAGSAANAGNALKTMISRILAPTAAASEILGLMGHTMTDLNWTSLNATQRLKVLAEQFVGLSDAQKVQVSATVASRWQINKFDQLMTDIINPLGYYQRALDATESSTANFAQRQKELNTVLSSNPARLKQMWTTLQNALADVVQPLLPWIVYLASSVAKLANSFSQMPPATQKTVLLLLGLLAVFGPLGRYIGSVAILFGELGSVIKFIAKGPILLLRGAIFLLMGALTGLGTLVGAIAGIGPRIVAGFAKIVPFLVKLGPRIIGVLTGPWGIAITAVATLIGIFWKDIQNFFSSIANGFRKNAEGIQSGWAGIGKFFSGIVNGIIRVFYRLPQGIQGAMMSVVNIVKAAAMAVYKLFSYLNPFAHHSPSLVESVTWGMAIIKKQYASVGNVGGIFAQAAGDLAKFKSVAASMNFDQWSSQRTDVASSMPSNLGNFDQLVSDWKTLDQLAIAQKNDVNAQTVAVENWKNQLDDANNSLDVQTAILDQLKNALDVLKTAYDDHQAAIDNYTNTGITGMKDMSDAIFNNEMAQKGLELQIMNLEDAGGSIQTVIDQMNALQGSIESLRGEANDLQASGAGSDILGPINDQLKQMQDSYDAMGQTVANSPMADLQAQLDALKRQGDRLNLENSLNFDPLTRQIQDAAKATKEMSFDDIIAGIGNERAAMAALQPQIDAAQAAYTNQAGLVDTLTASRDALNVTYQQENAALQALQGEYDTTTQAIRDIESALNDAWGSARSSASSGGSGGGGGGGGMSPDAQNFIDGAGGNWADVGGGAGIATPGLGDQTDLINQMTDDLQKELSGVLASLDPTAGLRSWWDKVVNWWNTTAVPGWAQFSSSIGAAFSGVDFSGFQDKWQTLVGWFSKLGDLFGPQFSKIWENLSAAVGPAVAQITEKLGPLWDAIVGGWNAVFPVLQVLAGYLGGSFLTVLSMVFSTIGNIVGPIVRFIGGAISGLIEIITGIIKVISGIINGFVGMFQFLIGFFTGNQALMQEGWDRIWSGFVDVIQGLSDTIVGIWDTIYATIEGVISTIAGVVQGFIGGIIDAWQWLYDTLIGHSIIPDLVNGITEWFGKLWTNVTNWVSNLISTVSNFFSGLWNNVYGAVSSFVTNVVTWFAGLPQRVRDGIGDLLITLHDKGLDLIIGIWNGIKEKWNEVTGWLWGIGGSVLKAVGDLGSTLWNAGVNILAGFFGGLKSKWDEITGWFSGIGKWIADHKGPKAYDLALLVPAGNQIMQGFGMGLESEFKNVQKQVEGFGPKLANSFKVPAIPVEQLNAQLKSASATVSANATAQNETLVQNSETKVFNFYGDLQFPGVQSGGDAEGFIRNLSDLAGAK